MITMMIAGMWPAYLLGGLLCFSLWRITKHWPKPVRISLRSFALAITVAPGVWIGHGFAIVPAFYVILIYVSDWPSNVNPSLAWSGGVWPFVIVWIISAAVLSLF